MELKSTTSDHFARYKKKVTGGFRIPHYDDDDDAALHYNTPFDVAVADRFGWISVCVCECECEFANEVCEANPVDFKSEHKAMSI